MPRGAARIVHRYECRFSCSLSRSLSACQKKRSRRERMSACLNISSECAAARHQSERSSRRPYVRPLQYSRARDSHSVALYTRTPHAIRTTDTDGEWRALANIHSIWTRSPEFRFALGLSRSLCLVSLQSGSGPTAASPSGLNGLTEWSHQMVAPNTALCAAWS